VTLGGAFGPALDAARRGEAGGIEALYRDTAPLVLGYLRANRAPDPEDLTSDVFVSVIGSIDRFTGDEAHFRSWLLTIAHRRMVDALRRSGRRPEDPVPDDRLVGGTEPAAEAQALQRLRAHGILDAIDGLTDDQRAVLLLRVVADLPVKEVAAVVGKPETAVKALLRRAVASVGRRLDVADGSPTGDQRPGEDRRAEERVGRSPGPRLA
jgi:RNA polymerase sigma-70 factor (ECF subfamily)